MGEQSCSLHGDQEAAKESVYANRLVPFVPPPPPYYWMVLATFRVGFLPLPQAPTDTNRAVLFFFLRHL